MKKTALIIIAIITSIQLSAQFETNLKLGISSYNDVDLNTNTTPGFYPYVSFGYRFLNQEHITLIPSLLKKNRHLPCKIYHLELQPLKAFLKPVISPIECIVQD